MSDASTSARTARCSCGSVELEVLGAPITSVACYCDDCEAGGVQVEGLPGARPVREPDGGTPYVLYRKDRYRCSKGEEHLQGHKLREDSATNRVVATCCNTAMLLAFDGGPHWVSVYRARMQSDAPPLQMRIYTKGKRKPGDASGDVPSYATFPLRFVAKLIAARVAMLLGR